MKNEEFKAAFQSESTEVLLIAISYRTPRGMMGYLVDPSFTVKMCGVLLNTGEKATNYDQEYFAHLLAVWAGAENVTKEK